MTEAAKVLEIDLTGFDSDVNLGYGYWRQRNQRHYPTWKLDSSDEAKRAVRESGITRECDKVDNIRIVMPQRVEGMTETFMRFFLGPAARKLTPDVLKGKLVIAPHTHAIAVSGGISRFLEAEKGRIAERAAKKAKEDPKEIVWGEPTGLFVPDIGTKMRLVLPWQTKIISEYRNSAMMELLTGNKNQPYWRSRESRERVSWDITIQPGAVLAVDRVYIRQGKGFEDFSSLTFRLAKGATVMYNGESLVTKKSIRFFSSLRFVNKMLVEVDLNTLPGQEKDGTARKK